MKLHFYKYQGTGNDFILIDDRQTSLQLTCRQVAQLCDRRFGIGADGLILLQRSETYDFGMVYFNADGQQGSLCGNGGRATVRFAADLGIIQEKTRFLAADGPHEASLAAEVISLKMNDVTGFEAHPDYVYVHTGSPHVVQFVEKVNDFQVFEEGRRIRHAWDDRGGTNVNFVEQTPDGLFVRTFERGVENETFSCGTGVTAAALVACRQAGLQSPVSIHTLGGPLSVRFTAAGPEHFTDIYLTGPARRVFEGTIDI